MTEKLVCNRSYSDINLGCDYFELEGVSDIKICYVKFNDIGKISIELSKHVLDTSWMTKLDKGSQRAYDKTAHETAAALVDIFKKTLNPSDVGSEFGEVLVSIGSAKALEKIFDHFVLPLAELWKPQKKQNEGFDFHTVCKSDYINFGEAKYSGSANPHGDAISQAKRFLDQEKHLRDYVHLRNFVSSDAIGNLNNDSFGIVASFSINSDDPIRIFKNAIKTARETLPLKSIKSIYLVGVVQ